MNIHVRRVANASIVVIGVIIDRMKRRNLPKGTAIAMMRVARPYELLIQATPESEDSNARRSGCDAAASGSQSRWCVSCTAEHLILGVRSCRPKMEGKS